MPLSTQLALAVRVLLDEARRDTYNSPEMRAIAPLLELQKRWSIIPRPNELLIEQTRTRDGYHTFLFPLAGRLVHEGLAALLAWRITRLAPRTVSVYATDYGVEVMGSIPLELEEDEWRQLLSTDELLDDILACVNTSELARRQFRDIARIAGLIFSGYPGQQKSTRQIQASSSILFEVFNDYDPGNLLLGQARREVLEQQLEVARLRTLLESLDEMELRIVETRNLTPLAFPLFADRLRSQEVSSENWEQRVRRMVAELEMEADDL
jgi:ATP-dependent Lhr-like helicase